VQFDSPWQSVLALSFFVRTVILLSWSPNDLPNFFLCPLHTNTPKSCVRFFFPRPSYCYLSPLPCRPPPPSWTSPFSLGEVVFPFAVFPRSEVLISFFSARRYSPTFLRPKLLQSSSFLCNFGIEVFPTIQFPLSLSVFSAHPRLSSTFVWRLQIGDCFSPILSRVHTCPGAFTVILLVPLEFPLWVLGPVIKASPSGFSFSSSLLGVTSVRFLPRCWRSFPVPINFSMWRRVFFPLTLHVYVHLVIFPPFRGPLLLYRFVCTLRRPPSLRHLFFFVSCRNFRLAPAICFDQFLGRSLSADPFSMGQLFGTSNHAPQP